MRILIAVLAGSVLAVVAGCAGTPDDRPPDTVQASSIHEKRVRDKLWKELYKGGEKEARERMEGVGESETTD
jgi:hypothetical protein